MNRGLHQPGEFRDNCGFGLIAHMEGQASHDLLKTAIESLTCMTHRGGIAADGKNRRWLRSAVENADPVYAGAGQRGV